MAQILCGKFSQCEESLKVVGKMKAFNTNLYLQNTDKILPETHFVIWKNVH
jgi:hypothetical protein